MNTAEHAHDVLQTRDFVVDVRYLPQEFGYLENEIQIKKSRFIARLTRIASEDEYKSFIEQARKDNHGCRHVCSAAVYRDGGQVITRSSDDGEPSGTAGRPMLDVLQGSGLMDVAVVVIRYFGGTLLGAGGLVRAYSESTSLVLEGVKRLQRVEREVWQLPISHAEAGRVESDLRAKGIQVIDVEYGSKAVLNLLIADADQARTLIQDVTNGAGRPEVVGVRTVELPLDK